MAYVEFSDFSRLFPERLADRMASEHWWNRADPMSPSLSDHPF
jgi:hypothetical protein